MSIIPKPFLKTLLLLFLLGSIFSEYVYARPLTYRGLEQEETSSSDLTRKFFSGLFWLPRGVLDGTLYGIGKTAKVVGDPDFIEAVEDILYLYERKLAWFPIIKSSNGFRPSYGVGLYYDNVPVKALTKFALHDRDYWSFDAKLSYQKAFENSFWKTKLLFDFKTQDDLRFHGVGKDPESDQRNRFITLEDQDYGVFSQEKRRVGWQNQLLMPRNFLELGHLVYYERKSFRNSGRGDNDLEDVFDLGQIPGFDRASVAQIYNEISAAVDTRTNQKRISPGFRSEIYAGISNGVSGNPSDLFKVGTDVIVTLPFSQKNRLITSRLTLDYVSRLDDEEIHFSDFPRHQAFRGTSERDWVRSDQALAVPSLEYQWPVSPYINGHLFVDYAVVGKKITELGFKDGLWAVGGAFDLHIKSREMGRLTLSGGSEGLYFKISVGEPFKETTRLNT